MLVLRLIGAPVRASCPYTRVGLTDPIEARVTVMAMLTPSPATPPAWLAREERHAARHAIRFETRLSVGTDEAIAVTIADLTQLGCRVIGRGGLTMGKYVTLDLAPVGPVQGWIASAIPPVTEDKFSRRLTPIYCPAFGNYPRNYQQSLHSAQSSESMMVVPTGI